VLSGLRDAVLHLAPKIQARRPRGPARRAALAPVGVPPPGARDLQPRPPPRAAGAVQRHDFALPVGAGLDRAGARDPLVGQRLDTVPQHGGLRRRLYLAVHPPGDLAQATLAAAAVLGPRRAARLKFNPVKSASMPGRNQ